MQGSGAPATNENRRNSEKSAEIAEGTIRNLSEKRKYASVDAVTAWDEEQIILKWKRKRCDSRNQPCDRRADLDANGDIKPLRQG